MAYNNNATFNWHDAPRWHHNLRQFLGYRRADGTWMPAAATVQQVTLCNDQGQQQFTVRQERDGRWIYITPHTADAERLTNALGAIATNGPIGNRQLPALHQLISYNGQPRPNFGPPQNGGPPVRSDRVQQMNDEIRRLREERNAARDERDAARTERDAKAADAERTAKRLRDANDARDAAQTDAKRAKEDKQAAFKEADDAKEKHHQAKALADQYEKQRDELIQLCTDQQVSDMPTWTTVKNEPQTTPIGEAGGYSADLTWSFDKDAASSPILSEFRAWQNRVNDHSYNEALLGPSTVAYGWACSNYEVFGCDLVCACKSSIALGHEEKLQHVVFMSKCTNDGKARSALNDYEEKGHITRPLPAELSKRLLLSFGHFLRIAILSSTLMKKDEVEDALQLLHGLRSASPHTIIENAEKMWTSTVMIRRDNGEMGDEWKLDEESQKLFDDLVVSKHIVALPQD